MFKPSRVIPILCLVLMALAWMMWGVGSRRIPTWLVVCVGASAGAVALSPLLITLFDFATSRLRRK